MSSSAGVKVTLNGFSLVNNTSLLQVLFTLTLDIRSHNYDFQEPVLLLSNILQSASDSKCKLLIVTSLWVYPGGFIMSQNTVYMQYIQQYI